MRLAWLTTAALVLACAPSRTEKVADMHRTVEKERAPEKLVERGKMFMAVGDLTRACQYFSAALDEGAEEHEVLPLLLEAHIKSSRYRDAITIGKRYLQRRPSDYKLRFLVGTLYAAIGESAQARTEFQQVLVTHPKHAQAHYALAVILRDSENDWVRADYHFRQYLKLEPEGQHAEEARASLLKTVP